MVIVHSMPCAGRRYTSSNMCYKGQCGEEGVVKTGLLPQPQEKEVSRPPPTESGAAGSVWVVGLLGQSGWWGCWVSLGGGAAGSVWVVGLLGQSGWWGCWVSLGGGAAGSVWVVGHVAIAQVVEH